jgi:hypothetical protein
MSVECMSDAKRGESMADAKDSDGLAAAARLCNAQADGRVHRNVIPEGRAALERFP